MDGKRLLIIEMDRILREAISRLFVLRGWHVERAATVGEGLAKMVRPPDCLLLDVRSPDRPVGELIRKAQAGEFPARVVVFTGFDADDLLDRLEGLVVDAVIQKPAEASALFQACEATV
jgi:DNA-binding NarL/FixJ family response regulator